MSTKSTVWGEEPAQSDLPNILWLTSEDNGPELGCYGDQYAETPNIDALAARGLRFTNCWSNAPVCAPARTTIISGMWPTSLGAQHMRSQVALPKNAVLYPQVLKQAGYYCTNNSKEDYNLDTPKTLWDESSNKAHWRNRSDGQPFFAIFNFTISHESKIRNQPHDLVHDPDDVIVPPFHPDLPEIRRDWAQYYDRLTEMDALVGKRLAELEEAGLADDTIVFYYGDHGTGMPRGKRWLYQTGLHVPLIVHVPERFQHLVGPSQTPGSTVDELVGFIDLAPTLCSLIQQPIPECYQGRAFLGPNRQPEPKVMIGFRDRMDERYDCSRAVRTRDFLYIRNWMPQRAQGQFLDYMFQTPTTRVWQQAFLDGTLDAAQSYFWEPKDAEELYDLRSDPYQVHNLASQSKHAATLTEMRSQLKKWSLATRDTGLVPEPIMRAQAASHSPADVFATDSEFDHSEFDVERVYDAASKCLIDRDSMSTVEEWKTMFTSQDTLVRYWAANGLLARLVRGEIFAFQLEDLEAAWGSETESSNLVVINEVRARFGSVTRRKQALEQLLQLADPDRESWFVAMAALNALDYCDLSQVDEGGTLASIRTELSDRWPDRYKPYVGDLVKRVQSTLRAD